VKIDQNHLGSVIRKLFPTCNVLTNARKLGQVQSPLTSGYLELDFWIPELKLAFEYQDPHHYLTSTWYSHAALTRVQQQDDTKKQMFSSANRTLIVVPCWWDGCESSLAASVRSQRPELLSGVLNDSISLDDASSLYDKDESSLSDSSPLSELHGSSCSPHSLKPPRLPVSPIPNNPPIDYFTGSAEFIPLVGSLMLVSFAPSSLFDPVSWWLSEKYDGLRGAWNTFKLYSRTGREILVPPCVSHYFPNECLDGELWYLFLHKQQKNKY
jgi:hypothetical protein